MTILEQLAEHARGRGRCNIRSDRARMYPLRKRRNLNLSARNTVWR